MGASEIKYGDSLCYVQHVDSGLWLTYQAIDAKCARLGAVQRKVIEYIFPVLISAEFHHTVGLLSI